MARRFRRTLAVVGAMAGATVLLTGPGATGATGATAAPGDPTPLAWRRSSAG